MKQARSYLSEKRTKAAEETRHRIVTTAMQMLARGKTGADITLEKVASRAKVTRKTVYDHFDGRAGLIEAIFDEAGRQAGLIELPKAFANPEPMAALEMFVAIFCRFLVRHNSVLPGLVTAVTSDPELARRVAKRAERRRQGLTVLVKRLGLKGDKDIVDVLFAVTSMEFFNALKRDGRDGEEAARLVQQTVRELVSVRLAAQRS